MMNFPGHQACNVPISRLHHVIRNIHPPTRSGLGSVCGPRFIQSPARAITKDMVCGIDCDEVYPGIFIGDEASARNKDFLLAAGITHVLNTAEGNNLGQVCTGPNFYYGCGIRYLGIDLLDVPDAPALKYFERGAAFIDTALSSGGKVLVHCLMGLSRSSTFVVAYLIMKKSMSAEEALHTLRLQRDIRPNDGFLYQLVDLENKLRGRRPT